MLSHPPLSSTLADGDINECISIFLGNITTVLNVAKVVILGEERTEKTDTPKYDLELFCADF